MGIISHHAIVVTTFDYKNYIETAHAKATDIFGESANMVSPIAKTTINGYRSFCIFPDGSKEGWSASDEGDARRDEFIEWLGRQRYSDGSTPYTWAEIEMGECGSERGNGSGATVRRHYRQGVTVGNNYRGPADLDAKDSR